MNRMLALANDETEKFIGQGAHEGGTAWINGNALS